MKNSISAAAFVLALALPGVAMAENTPKQPVAKTMVDTITTQSVSDRTTHSCKDGDGFPLENNRCSIDRQYPENALTGLNLGQ